MFCRNCGNELSAGAAFCTRCGVPAGRGNSFCQNCGNSTVPEAVVCVTCGAPLIQASYVAPTNMAGQKSRMVAGLLGIFVGGLGIHNFYLGNTTRGVIQILLSFCFGIGAIWGFIEGILILAGQINTDANGMPLGN